MSFVSQFKAQAKVMAGDLRHRKIIRTALRNYEILVEVINGFPFYFRRKLPRALPVLKRRLALVADNLVIAQRGANDFAMT